MSIETGFAPRVDSDWFSLVWYGQTLERLCTEAGLRRLQSPVSGPLATVTGVSSGHFVATSSELQDVDRDLTDAVVVGGPCMGDCQRSATLEALYDIVQPLVVARALDLPAMLYLGDREEILGGGKESRWFQLAERFEGWIHDLAQAVGVQQLRVVRTSSSVHDAALASAGLPVAAATIDELDRAFHLGSVPLRSQGADGHEVTRRVVGAHLPGVIGRHLQRPDDRHSQVIMVENLQQAGVFTIASRHAATLGQAVGLAAYLPAPSPSGRNRMYRAEPWDKIPSVAIDAVVDGSPPALHPRTKHFFGSWLDDATRASVSRVARAW